MPVELRQALVRLAVAPWGLPLDRARQALQHRCRGFVLGQLQLGLPGREAGGDFAEASHVLARAEHLRQAAGTPLLEPLQLLLGAVAEPLLRDELTPSESSVFQLQPDRPPLFRVPLKAPADLLRELRRALLGLLRERRPG